MNESDGSESQLDRTTESPLTVPIVPHTIHHTSHSIHSPLRDLFGDQLVHLSQHVDQYLIPSQCSPHTPMGKVSTLLFVLSDVPFNSTFFSWSHTTSALGALTSAVNNAFVSNTIVCSTAASGSTQGSGGFSEDFLDV